MFFDEAHISQKSGLVSRTGIQIKFPRSSDGVFTPSSPDNPNVICNEKLKQPIFKYEKEARFLLGAYVTKDKFGNYVG